MCLLRIGCVMFALLGAPLLSAGADESQRLLSQRAAEEDARQRLADVIYALPLAYGARVEDLARESDLAAIEIDQLVRAARFGLPLWFSDHRCEVEADVPVEQLVDALRRAQARLPRGSALGDVPLDELRATVGTQLLRVLGVGAARVMPRDEAPVDSPPPPLFVPELWQTVPPQARLMAIQAARLDAQRRLAERIGGFRISADSRMRDFMLQSDEVRTRVDGVLAGGREVQVVLRPDELIAEVTLRLPADQVRRSIRMLESGNGLSVAEVQALAGALVQQDAVETGRGVAAAALQQLPRPRSGPPAWADQMLQAEGRGRDAEADAPQGKLRAFRAAELDARQNLAERVGALVLPGGELVSTFVQRRPDAARALDAEIFAAAIASNRFDENGAAVVVGLPGMQVWGALNEWLRREASP